MGDEWADVAYPDLFLGGATVRPGTYTVIWYVERDEVAQDEFTIR